MLPIRYTIAMCQYKIFNVLPPRFRSFYCFDITYGAYHGRERCGLHIHYRSREYRRDTQQKIIKMKEGNSMLEDYIPFPFR